MRKSERLTLRRDLKKLGFQDVGASGKKMDFSKQKVYILVDFHRLWLIRYVAWGESTQAANCDSGAAVLHTVKNLLKSITKARPYGYLT